MTAASTLRLPRVVDTSRPARRSREAQVGRVFVAPAVILAVVFVYLPAIVALVASFFNVPLNKSDPISWVGFGNFSTLFSSGAVHQAFWNTVLYCVMTIVPTLVIGFGLALLVDSLPSRQVVISTLLFLPLTANMVAMAVVFDWIYAPMGGFLDTLLGYFGVGSIDFLNNPHTALPAVAAIGVWRSSSFAMVLFMAGMTTIPETVKEAAAMDGLRGLAKTTRVTIPMLRPTVVLVTIVSVIQSVQVFDTINVLTQGGPDGSTQTVLVLIWQLGFNYFQLGQASALTLLMLVVLVFLGWLQRKSLFEGR